MILRYWRGWTTAANAPAYEEIVEAVLAEIAARDIAGYRGAYLMRRELGEETQFATALLFDAMDSVREFAGDDYERAYVPANAREVLARYDERSAHFDVLLTPDETGWPAFLTRPPA
jgi:antibiotic biosynthesis monooxygenase (ABM) superfamily enzyme